MSKQDLPKIIYFESKADYGEYGAALCPHCGAKGRYIYWFICEDGHRYGAMAGCVKLFPWHTFAYEHKRIMDKETSKKKLCSWDEEMKAAIEAFAHGKMDEAAARREINLAKRKRSIWMKRRRW